MQIGGALGSLCARALGVAAAERRILMVAGVAAGIAAVFRTPLGAALLAVEVLYRDDFESDALIPAVLASVTAYSIVISIFGESTLFASPGRFPFVIKHLWLYAVLALLVSVLASLFLKSLRTVQRLTAALSMPTWARPALGGLAVGVFCVPIIMFVGWHLGQPGQGIGLLGGGYGAVQVAISGANWLPIGWTGAALLLCLCLAKIVASSLTIGSGGSAGDFAPALVIGGLFGGAFGRAAQLLLGDPRIDPGAFALVAMGTFYGGVAHTPLSSLVLVCELAGSYDLLVPLMLAEGIAFIALRHKSLYQAQLPTQRDSPAHQITDVLRATQVMTVMRELSVSGVPIPARAHSVRADADLRTAAQLLLTHKLREVQVVDASGQVVGLLDEAEIARVYLKSADKQDDHKTEPPPEPKPPA
jgi:CIC family chloride channel protein